MAAINTTAAYQELLSLALEERSDDVQDLVSNSNILLTTIKEQDNWQPYSGPYIRERLLYNEQPGGGFYSDYDFLQGSPVELINDAVYTPKQGYIPIVLSNREILDNSGANQMKDVVSVHMKAAEQQLMDIVDTSLHGDGTGYGGKEFTGLKAAVPTTVNTGTYGGISRANNAIWRTNAYDANSYFTGQTGVSSTNILAIYSQIAVERSRAKEGPNLIIASMQHYLAFQAATVAIQRITSESKYGKMGFTSLQFNGGGRSIDIVRDGGVGSNMPSDVSYLLDMRNLKFRYHPMRNFKNIFTKPQMPINQDAIVQYIGIMGELTMTNPLFQSKLLDSSV